MSTKTAIVRYSYTIFTNFNTDPSWLKIVKESPILLLPVCPVATTIKQSAEVCFCLATFIMFTESTGKLVEDMSLMTSFVNRSIHENELVYPTSLMKESSVNQLPQRMTITGSSKGRTIASWSRYILPKKFFTSKRKEDCAAVITHDTTAVCVATSTNSGKS